MGMWMAGAEPRALQHMGSSGQTALSPSMNPHLHTHAEEQPPQHLQLPKAHFINAFNPPASSAQLPAATQVAPSTAAP